MFETKVRPVLAILLMLGLCSLSVYLGNDTFNEYFSFGDNIVFSWLTVSFIALPVVMIFPFIYFTLLLLKGKEYAFKTMDAYVVYLKWGCIALVIIGVMYSVLYPTVLVKKDIFGVVASRQDRCLERQLVMSVIRLCAM
jgi:heme exporter protein D